MQRLKITQTHTSKSVQSVRGRLQTPGRNVNGLPGAGSCTEGFDFKGEVAALTAVMYDV
jgi:hypothetical protein